MEPFREERILSPYSERPPFAIATGRVLFALALVRASVSLGVSLLRLLLRVLPRAWAQHFRL